LNFIDNCQHDRSDISRGARTDGSVVGALQCLCQHLNNTTAGNLTSPKITIRVVPDLLFPNPAGGGFCQILMANPAGAKTGFFTVATT